MDGVANWKHEMRTGTPLIFVKRGKSMEKIVVEFVGGGACWSKETCGLQTATLSETAEGSRASIRDMPSNSPPKTANLAIQNILTHTVELGISIRILRIHAYLYTILHRRFALGQ